MTQEELAEALYVSRTAVSKWESGRGYPGIDSLKEISRFFSVTLDDLICADEILTAAEREKKESIGRYLSLICNSVDILPAILLFIPVFGNGAGSSDAVSLFAMTGVNPWVRAVFAAVIVVSVLNGIAGVIVANLNKPRWDRHRLATGIVLSIVGVSVFLAARQPYAGIFVFAVLVIKGCLMIRAKQQH